MKIWIVEGSTGEYSDRTDWVVCAYRTEEQAQEHAWKAMLRAKELAKINWNHYKDKFKNVVNEYDLKMRLDYSTGTVYYHFECELKD